MIGKAYNLQDKEGVYFVTFTVVEWVDIFSRRRYRDILLESFEYCQKNKGLVIHAWVVMSNHLHLIVSGAEGTDLSGTIRDLKKFTSKKILESIQDEAESRRNWMLWIFKSAAQKNKRNQEFQFWRQDNHAEAPCNTFFIQQKLDYIHQNPVKAGFVDNGRDWLYSSARDYEGEKGLIEIVHVF